MRQSQVKYDAYNYNDREKWVLLTEVTVKGCHSNVDNFGHWSKMYCNKNKETALKCSYTSLEELIFFGLLSNDNS